MTTRRTFFSFFALPVFFGQPKLDPGFYDVPLKRLKVTKPQRHHHTEVINWMAEEMRELGCCNPLIVDQDGEVIDGSYRFFAAKIAGLKTVPCQVRLTKATFISSIW